MKLFEAGKLGFKLWVIWSDSKLAQGIRSFLFLAALSFVLGSIWAICWAYWDWQTIVATPFVLYLLFYRLPLYIMHRNVSRDVAIVDARIAAREAYIKEHSARYDAAMKKVEERKFKGKKRNP